MDAHSAALTHQDDMVPCFEREHSFSGEELILHVAIEENEPARGVGAVSAADAEMFPVCVFISVLAAGEGVSGDSAGLRRQPVPEPHLHAVSGAKRDVRFHASTGE